MKRKKIVSYGKSLFLLIGILVVPGGCRSAKESLKQSYYYSPTGAIAAGPDGLPAKKISIQPYATAIEIRSKRGIPDNDPQWIYIPLSIQKGTIKSVTVCYSIGTSGSGKTFISQVRLIKMTTPDSATVLYDDDTDLVSASPACYTGHTKAMADGPVTLALRVVIDPSGAIQIGGITLEMEQKGRDSTSSPIVKHLINGIIENKIKTTLKKL